ncbi:MAG: hypothetical protein R3C26_26075 [Calditrichia bacterium]
MDDSICKTTHFRRKNYAVFFSYGGSNSAAYGITNFSAIAIGQNRDVEKTAQFE